MELNSPTSIKPRVGAVTEAIILAGGLGTRLRTVVSDLPKVLAPVADKPFLSYVIDALRMQGIERIVFSLGYKAELIEDFLKQHYPTLDYAVAIEEEPLGTGGGIHLAVQACITEHVLIANGDTLFRVDLDALFQLHGNRDAICTLALKPMQQFDRYGVVRINEEGRVISFEEKKWYDEGTINGGLYLLNRKKFMDMQWPVKFSFEKDFLEPHVTYGTLYAQSQDGYFIDIGIPEDFARAQQDLQLPVLNLQAVDSSWTLFLDRDGVINDERVGHYVLHWGEFIFSPGVLDTFRHFSAKFGKIIIVSNQRGVGRNLMSEETLQSIHLEMEREVQIAGGHIDHIYYCTDTSNLSFRRKPNPGMAFQALKDHPEININKCIMVGNKPSDMRFGRAAGMHTVFVATTNPQEPYPHPDVDLRFENLAAFARALES